VQSLLHKAAEEVAKGEQDAKDIPAEIKPVKL